MPDVLGDDPSDAAAGGRAGRGRERRREPLLHAAAAVLGPGVAVLLVGGAPGDLVWRTSALAVALSLVARGLVVAVGLGRAEWRRDPPSLGAYGWAGARFALALVLVVAATS